jgi:hypothetical protein
MTASHPPTDKPENQDMIPGYDEAPLRRRPRRPDPTVAHNGRLDLPESADSDDRESGSGRAS